MTRENAPALSVVLPVPDSWDRVRQVVRHLRAQTVSDRIELVVVTPSRDALHVPPGDLEGFAGARFVDIAAIRTTGEARAEGVRVARSPITAFAEDHSFPDPGWAEAAIRAHEEGFGAIGLAMRNANGGTAWSWADLLLNFGPSVPPVAAGETAGLPWHNTAYRTDLLRRYGDALPLVLDAESLLQQDLRQRGERLCQLEIATDHTNASRPSFFFHGHFWGARLIWASRASRDGWSAPRRLAVAAASPGLAPLRAVRALRHALRIGLPVRRVVSIGAPVVLGSLAVAAGAATGLLAGLGPTLAHRTRIEFDLRGRVRPEEFAQLHGKDVSRPEPA